MRSQPQSPREAVGDNAETPAPDAKPTVQSTFDAVPFLSGAETTFDTATEAIRLATAVAERANEIRVLGHQLAGVASAVPEAAVRLAFLRSQISELFEANAEKGLEIENQDMSLQVRCGVQLGAGRASMHGSTNLLKIDAHACFLYFNYDKIHAGNTFLLILA